MFRLLPIALVFSLFAQARVPVDVIRDLEKLLAELRLLVDPPPPLETVVKAGDSLPMALALAVPGATLVLETDAVFTCNCLASRAVTLKGRGMIVTLTNGPGLTVTGPDVQLSEFVVRPGGAQNVDDLLVLRGPRPRLTDLVVEGNGATKRGIQANGVDMVFTRVRVANIRQKGTESQAVAIWDGTGLTIRDSYLQGAGQSFLAGGSSPAVPNHVPADILIEGSTLTRDREWKGGGFSVKTGLELKSARRVVVRDTLIEHVFVDAQIGAGITLTASQYGNSPENVVEQVLFERVTVSDVSMGINLTGFSQHQATRPTLRAHDIEFRDCTFIISKAANGGHGTLMQVGWEPADVRFIGNKVKLDGESFIMTTDSKPIAGYVFRGNTVDPRTGTYGIWTPTGSRGAGFATLFPGGIVSENFFTGAHATFKANFPANTYLPAPVARRR